MKGSWKTRSLAILTLLTSVAVGENDKPGSSNLDFLPLSKAIDLALAENLNLQIERTLLDDAWQDLIIARSEFDPALTGQGSTSQSVSPQARSALDGAAKPEVESSALSAGLETKLATGALVDFGSEIIDRTKTNSNFTLLNPIYNTALRLQVTQPLLQGAGFRYNLTNIRLAELGIEQANYVFYDQLLTLLQQTETAYWSVVAAEQERDVTQKSIELSLLIVEEAEGRKEANLATETDVLEARASLAERREVLLTTQGNVENARDELFRLLGILLEVDPMEPGFEPLPPRVRVVTNAKSSFQLARHNNPVMLLARSVRVQRARESARQRNELLPQLDLTLSTGILGRDGSFGGAHRSLRESDGHYWDAGLQLRIPWGNRQDRARYRQAQNAEARAKLEEDETLLDLYALVRQVVREVELARKSYDATQVTLDLAERKLEQQRELYQAGQIPIRDVLEAQNDLDSARFRQIQTRVRELNAIVQLAEVEGTLPERYGLKLRENPKL